MIVAHLSETHLGYRAYDRTREGRNVRERDVEEAFLRAVEEVARIGPDLILLVGDVFDRPDPPPGAVVALGRGLEALRTAVPGAPVALVAGLRDRPVFPGDPGALSLVESLPGVEAAVDEMVTVGRPDLDLRLVLLPGRSAAGDRREPPEPDDGVRWNVLAGFAGVSGGDGRGLPLEPARWSYVALGGEHTHRTVGPGVVYAGSLERVGGAPWEEAMEEKGFVTADLASGRTAFHPLPVRPVVSLAPVRTRDRSGEALRRRVLEVTSEVPGGIEDKVVRLQLQGASPVDLLALQGDLMAELRGRALHLALSIDPTLPPPTLPDRLEEILTRIAAAPGLREWMGRAMAQREPPPVLPGTLRGDVPGLGRLELTLPEGIVGLVSRDEPPLRALVSFMAETLGPEGPWLATASLGEVGREVRRWVRALERVYGFAGLETLPSEVPEGGRGEDPAELRRRIGELEGAEAELDRLEEELRDLRADHAEAAGDVEGATMEWLRERQDAETNLHAYRDRARELRARLAQIQEAGPDAPCPTCGRGLKDHYDHVVAELEDEWDSVVQDGSWWKRRREQLDLKPEGLQAVEGRALRLQAAVESSAERLEEVRVRTRELSSLRRRLARAERAGEDEAGAGVTAGRPGEAGAGPEQLVAEIRVALRSRLLEAASRDLLHMTDGRLLVIRDEEGETLVHRADGAPVELAHGDRVAVSAALRLGATRVAVEGLGGPVDTVLFTETEGLSEDDRSRLVELLGGLRTAVRRVLVTGDAELGHRRPELFDELLEVADVHAIPEGRDNAVRPLPAGRSRLVLRDAAGAAAGSQPPP